MPTSRPRKNPLRVGDVVTIAHGNGSGEGVLWRVTKTKLDAVRIEPVWTVTGPSVLKPKWVHWLMVKVPDLAELASLYSQLGNIIADMARIRGMNDDGAPGEEAASSG